MVVSYKQLGMNGRLGNQLWQIASTVGIAHQNGDRASFPPWEYQPYFQIPEKLFTGEEGTDGGTAYLQELHYFAEIDWMIREYFKPRDAVIEEVKRRWPAFFELDHTTSVHFRRGDYVGLPRHFPMPTKSYYDAARALIKRDTTFVVFSDDIAWCQANLDFPDGAMFIDGVPRPVEIKDRSGAPQDQYDLILQTFCDRHVISNSTFSWWGAWLSEDKQVIYPNRWFGPALAEIPWRKMIPGAWIEVPC